MKKLKLGSLALIYTGPNQNELYVHMLSTQRNVCRLHFRTQRATQTGNHKQRVRHMMAHVFVFGHPNVVITPRGAQRMYDIARHVCSLTWS